MPLGAPTACDRSRRLEMDSRPCCPFWNTKARLDPWCAMLVVPQVEGGQPCAAKGPGERRGEKDAVVGVVVSCPLASAALL